MTMDRKKLAKLLGADVSGEWLNMPGPGHSKMTVSSGSFSIPLYPTVFGSTVLRGMIRPFAGSMFWSF